MRGRHRARDVGADRPRLAVRLVEEDAGDRGTCGQGARPSALQDATPTLRRGGEASGPIGQAVVRDVQGSCVQLTA